MVKLIMTWSIRQGKETEYVEFLTHDFVRLVMGVGFHPLDAWYSVWGHGPQVIAGGMAKDLKTMEQALDSQQWRTLRERLEQYVIDLKIKVVEASRGFQL